MKPVLQHGQYKRPWLALLAAACLVLAIPAGRFVAVHFAPAEDLLGYGGLAAGLSAILATLLAGLASGILSLLRRESARRLVAAVLFADIAALAWLFIMRPG